MVAVMAYTARKSLLFLAVCCILILPAFNVFAEGDPDQESVSNNLLKEEKFIPWKKSSYSLFDFYKNSKSFISDDATKDFSELMVNYNQDYEMDTSDVTIDERRRRSVEESGCGTIPECDDDNLNNCTGSHVQCIELGEGFECGCDESYTWDAKEWGCYRNECSETNWNNCTGSHVRCKDLDDGFQCECDESFTWNSEKWGCFRDECSNTTLNNCTGSHVTCKDLDEGFQCECDESFTWNSEKWGCFRDECSNTTLNNCTGSHVTCLDLDEGFQCECDESFTWNSEKWGCFRDECTNTTLNNCTGSHVTCKDLDDGFQCECDESFTWNSEKWGCFRDECSDTALNNCTGSHVTCLDLDDGFQCECDESFTWNSEKWGCFRDECSNTTLNNCTGSHVTCLDLDDGFQCECDESFTWNSEKWGCFRDECSDTALNNCTGSHETCKDLDDGFQCECDESFTWNSEKWGCFRDECSNTTLNNCTGSHVTCLDLDDGFQCECDESFTWNSEKWGCFRDECSNTTLNNCTGSHVTCLDLDDGFQCECDESFTWNSEKWGCFRDECSNTTLNNCTGSHVTCLDLDDGFQCECDESFTWNSEKWGCFRDECSNTTLNNCTGSHVTCLDLDDGFQCECDESFTWNSEKWGCFRDECSNTTLNNCTGSHVTCLDLDDGFQCECDESFTWNSEKWGCFRDECSNTTLNNCTGSHVTCLDLDDGFQCECDESFTWNSEKWGCFRDECSNTTLNNCTGSHVTCLDLDDGFQCECDESFTWNSEKWGCFRDECSNTTLNNCTGSHVTCLDLDDGFQCECDESFTWNSEKWGCFRDECSNTTLNNCTGSHVTCLDLDDGFQCECDESFTWNSEKWGCFRDECSNTTLNNCTGSHVTCKELDEGFQCECDESFTWNSEKWGCFRDECSNTTLNNCTGSHVTCKDLDDGFQCECDESFTWNSEKWGCFRDECSNTTLNNCTGSHVTCKDLDEGFQCECDESFTWNSEKWGCFRDECSNTTLNNCTGSHVTCKDLDDGFQCECDESFTWNSEKWGCFRDECSNTTLNNCTGSHVTCKDLDDGFQCECDESFTWSAEKSGCFRDECSEANWNNCTGSHVKCKDLDDGFQCECDESFTWNSEKWSCLRDECSDTTLNNCTGSHVRCKDLDDSFQCECDASFTWNAQEWGCFRAECSKSNWNNCTGDHVKCIELADGFECGCEESYTWSPTKWACLRDECADESLNDCTGDHVKCIDLDDGFKCGCDKRYEWNSQDKACYWKLYPHGLAAQAMLLMQEDDSIRRIRVSSGIPFYSRKQTLIYIGSNGVVSFGRRYNPTEMIFPPTRRSVLCSYCADVDISPSDIGYISYGLYDKNYADAQVKAILERSNDDIVKYTSEGRFDASQVLIVTWYKVPKYGSEHPNTETATFQTVVITDGETTYALFIYNELNWKYDCDKIVIGYGENRNTRTISASGTRGAYTRQNIGGIRDETGFYVFRVGYVQSFSQKCMNWYASQLDDYIHNWRSYDYLPDCPCSTRRLRSDRRWRSIYGRTTGYRCTTLNYNYDFFPMGKKCCYNYGRFVSSGYYAGYAYRYHQWFSEINHFLSDTIGKYYCCTKSNLCDMFYSIRPTGTCSSRSLFQQGGAYGDPHIVTLDGRSFIFNGHGEYTLISIVDGDMKMDLQARTGRADTANGTATSATIFTAFAAQEKNKSKFHVELSPDKTKMYVFGNDEDGTWKDYTKMFEDNDINDEKSFITDQTLSSLTITKGESDELIVLFPSGNSFTIKKGPKLLTIDASIHTKYKEKTRGLLGNFDGNKENDFIFPNGTTLNDNLTEEDIFHYGQTWMITADKSVMKYPPRENADAYNFPDFIPMFLDQADSKLKEEAITICGGVDKIACVFDFVATGNREVADATKDKTTETDKTQAELANSIPVINSNSTRSLDIMMSKDAAQFQVLATDADHDVLVYEFTGETPGGVTLVLDNSTGAGSISTTSLDYMSLSFVVKDAKGAYSSVHQIVARVCDGCNDHGTCVFNESRSSVDAVETSDDFIVASCDCNTGWTGDNCSEDYDACDDKPCITGQKCTDLTPDEEVTLERGFNCSACPIGFEEITGKCADVNECTNGSSHGCDQHCENSPGSYSCSCDVGYRQDGKLCHDIDECQQGTHDCEQVCANNDGSYSCSCNYGFELKADNRTCNQTLSDCNMRTQKNCSYGCLLDADNTTYICSCKSGYMLNSDGFSCDNINECDRNICTQKCEDTTGSYVCSCFDGFKLAADKRSCEACTDLSYGANCGLTCECGDRASECHSVRGCVCNAGWLGTKCDQNVNECEQNKALCGDNMLCEDTIGSYLCYCLPGYQKNGTSCVDINECDTEANNCTQECTNVVGSFSCSCRPGFQGDNCNDVNECETDQHDCEQVCTNVQGSYNCECQFGYRLKEDRKTCEKVKDVCSLFSNVNCEHGCSVDESNKPYCFCNTGFRLAQDDEKCLDINECTTTDQSLKHKCSHECINTDAGYNCSCPIGYKLQNDHLTCKPCDPSQWGDNCVNTCECGIGATSCNSETGCQCKTSWRGLHCDEDINECNGGVTCPTNSVCQNTPGSYHCKCNHGYRMNNNSTICENIDECTENLHNCDQICTDKPGSFVCSCKSGFVWSEEQCKDIDECETQTYECEHLCQNTIGGYDCSCRSGFKLNITNRKTCLVETECMANNSCDKVNGGCQNNGTEEICFCNKGFSLNVTDNKTCDDIKECEREPGPCSEHGECNEMDGSYNCTCKDGYKLQSDKVSCRECDEGTFGTECAESCSCVTANTEFCNKTDGVCMCKSGWNGTDCGTDIDECEDANSTDCGSHSTCRNVDGSYLCYCDAGLFLFEKDCKACDEKHWGTNCAETCNCSVHAIRCNATDGTCTCKTGWEGEDCDKDIDECTVNTTICSDTANSVCKNNDGSFTCDCETGYKKTTAGKCEDINECLEGTDTCRGEHKMCNNTMGNYTCTDCCAGYEESSGGDCTDIDECTVNTTICSDTANSVCKNNDGSFTCDCETGYKKTTAGKCEDINECLEGTDSCRGEHKSCNNTMGNYTCTDCRAGYEASSGGDCTDIDECTVNATICSDTANSVCKNNDGSFTCDCETGYKKTTAGKCEDIDECENGTEKCPGDNKVCNNYAGGFQCACKTGYELKDNVCTDINECLTSSHGCEQQCMNTVGSYSCYCSSGFVIGSTDNKTCDETKKYKAIIVLEFDLNDKSTSPVEYGKDVAKIKEGLSAYFRSTIVGFLMVIINTVTRGSAVVGYDIVINSVLETDSAGSFTKAVLDLAKTGNINLGDSVNILRQQIEDKNVTRDTTPCSILEEVAPCPSGQGCEVVDGVAKCSLIKTEDNLPMIVGLSVGIPLFFIILALIVLVVFLRLKSKRKLDKSYSSDDSSEYHDDAFRSVFASSLAHRSRFGPTNIGYQMDAGGLGSFGKDGVSLPRYKMGQTDSKMTVQKDHREPIVETPGEFSWSLLANTLPSEPFEIKRPKISVVASGASPSFKRSAPDYDDLS